MIYQAVTDLLHYAGTHHLLAAADMRWARNSLLDDLQLHDWQMCTPQERPLEEILKDILDWAAAQSIIENDVTSRDLFDTKLMGRLPPPPSLVQAHFATLYAKNPEEATSWYYQFSQDTDYIRRYRIQKDMKWITATPYGDLDITINLSKPEKDPRAIAAAKFAPKSSYPQCLLCADNEGYAGNLNDPARQNHRMIPITINQSPWFLQYSPYVYYNEHCICLNQEHTPMKIDRACFGKLLDFVSQFPHYFIGSNADLPIVGGSILAHEHFQGGRYTFAMEKASIETALTFTDFEDVSAGIVKWPMSVLRIKCKNPDRLIDLADKILSCWRSYCDKSAVILAETNGEPHNTITPIARMRSGTFELDLVLRNNLTTAEHPLGLYHPHAELHHIKKENIGLIEVMGLAVLPARLKNELSQLSEAILAGRDIRSDEILAKHADWVEQLQTKYTFTQENVDTILQKEVGLIFAQVLEHAGVYKRTAEGQAAFLRFIDYVNQSTL